MLRRRLTIGAALAASLVSSACAGVDGTDGGVIRENVVEPGITAIGESRELACGADATAFRTAMDAYELFEGEPAPDETALVDAGFLRSGSELWDVVDGRLVAQDPACGDVPTSVPAVDIVTDPGDVEVPTVDEVLATFTDADVAEMGGDRCARQLAVVVAGASAFAAIEGVGPESIEQVDAAGYFDEPVTEWRLDGDVLRPAEGSSCADVLGDETTP